MSTLPMAVHRSGTPTLWQRTLFLDLEKIASVQIHNKPAGPTGVLTFPVNPDATLGTIVDGWLKRVVTSYQEESQPLLVEYWIGEDFYEFRPGVAANFKPTDIYNKIHASKVSASDFASLVLLSVATVTIELAFDEANSNCPFECTLILDKVLLPAVCNFFTTFHRNQRVRTNGEVAKTAFSPASSSQPKALNIFDPLPPF